MNLNCKLFFKIVFLLSIPIITLIIRSVNIEDGQTICLFNNILGVNCYGCGITKAILAFLNGEFYKALNYNANVIFVLPVLMFIWFKQFAMLFSKHINHYHIGVAAFILFSGCSTIASKLIPLKDLPSPNGQYDIGTQIFTWIDENREETFTEEANDKRKLSIQVWYPAEVSGKNYYPYLDNANKRIPPIAKRIEVPALILSGVKNVKTHSELNAKPIIGEFPLILFSHGLGGMKVQNTIQVEELVSNGYIVVASDHTYDANITIFQDGSIAEFRAGYDESISYTEQQFYDFRIPQINIRAADMSFVLNKIEDLQRLGGLWSNIDMSSVGIFGHSFGGGTAVVSSYNDKRIDACIALDGWIKPVPSLILENGIDVPFMFIGQEKWTDDVNYLKLDQLIENSSEENYKILIQNTMHFDYTDSPYFSDLSKRVGISGSMEADDIVDTLNFHINTFFKSHLH